MLAAVAVAVLGLLVLWVLLIIGERHRVVGIVLLVLISLGVPLVVIGLAVITAVLTLPPDRPRPRPPQFLHGQSQGFAVDGLGRLLSLAQEGVLSKSDGNRPPTRVKSR